MPLPPPLTRLERTVEGAVLGHGEVAPIASGEGHVVALLEPVGDLRARHSVPELDLKKRARAGQVMLRIYYYVIY